MEISPKRKIMQWTARRPPTSGPGSGRDAWVRFAMAIAQANRILWETIETRSQRIGDLEAELMVLRGRVTVDPIGIRWTAGQNRDPLPAAAELAQRLAPKLVRHSEMSNRYQPANRRFRLFGGQRLHDEVVEGRRQDARRNVLFDMADAQAAGSSNATRRGLERSRKAGNTAKVGGDGGRSRVDLPRPLAATHHPRRTRRVQPVKSRRLPSPSQGIIVR